ncbi:MAG: translation factor GTPase family protein [Tetrasphaera sp.]
MSILNLGVLAHVDAGKTSLTERLLYLTGAISTLGRVDDGTTQTDSLELEARRGITFRAAVTSFSIGDLLVNVVDTPGHPDFIAEVERSLTVLDAAVLVLSAVEGVQAQTVVLWRALRRLGVPTVLFVNKIDRVGADVGRVERQVRRRLTGDLVVLSEITAQGSRAADVRVRDLCVPDVLDTAALADEQLFAAVSRGPGSAPTEGDVEAALRRGIRAGRVTPLLCGSAITGAGVGQLTAVLPWLIPPAIPWGRSEPPAGTVFAVDREAGQRRAWIRLWGGQIGIRDRLRVPGREGGRVTQLAVSRPGGVVRATAVDAGEIAAVSGLELRIGDVFGTPPGRRRHRFAPATLRALVETDQPSERTRLWASLAELADEDPLIGLTLDPHAGEASVDLHGEVQREVVEETLRRRFGVVARFRETAVICLERPLGSGAGVERCGEDGNPYLASIGLRVEPLPVGRGIVFSPGIERGNLPADFVAATEEGVRAGLRQGRYGWAVTDIRVTMTESHYWPRQSAMHQKFNKAISSVAADFRSLAPVVLHAALRQAGTAVCEPVERFDLDVPEAAFPAVAALLGRCGAVVAESAGADGHVQVRGTVATSRLRALTSRLPDLTGGEAVLVSELDHHAPVIDGRPPERPRRGPDPADRLTWFRDVPR